MDRSAHGRKGRSKARSETPVSVLSDGCDPVGVPSDGCDPVSKTAEIRKAARFLVSNGLPPRPIDIVARLKKAGIDVTSAQVSTALAGTEFAFRRNREEWERPRSLFPDPALALSQVSIEDVLEARKFVERLGGLKRAMAALVALGQFGGEAKTGPRAVSDVGESVSLEEPDRSPPDDTTNSRMRKVV
jgi:hypothetical protein